MDFSWIPPVVFLQTAARFAVVTVFAQRLPGVFIPEKRMIAAMGYDMVDHSRGRQRTIFQAFGAQRMPGQKRLPRLSPVCVITTGSRAAANGVMAPFFSVLLAVNPFLAEIGTARITAWAFWSSRHIAYLIAAISRDHRTRNRCRSGFSSPDPAP